MVRDLESILSDILNGTDEKPALALDAYRDQFTAVIEAAATAMTADDPTRPLVADRVMQFARTVQRSFSPVFAAATDPEERFNAGLVLLMFGIREPLPWLLAVATTPGPMQYDVLYQLGHFRLPEVRGTILDKLRSVPLIDKPRVIGAMTNSDWICNMLALWRLTGEPLPDDVLTRLRSAEASREVKAALKDFGSQRAESTLKAAVRADGGGATLAPELESIISNIIHGTGEQRLLALDVYHEQFAAVIEAAAKAAASQTPAPMRMWVADRVMRLGHRGLRAFRPLFATATVPEVKFLSALVLMTFGSRESLPWLLNVASTAGPFQYQATLHLGQLRLPEARGVILSQLRSLSLSNGDAITAMLDVWKLTGEPLPADVLARLRSADAATSVKVTLDSLGLGLPGTTDP